MSELPRWTVTYKRYPDGRPRDLLVAAEDATEARTVACDVKGIDLADIITVEAS